MIAQEGILSIGSNDVYVCPSKSVITISKIVFNYSGAYDVLLEIYRASSSSTNTVYDLSLNAGDTVIDMSEYFLNAGDKLVVTTNALINYNLMGRDNPNIISPFPYNQ